MMKSFAKKQHHRAQMRDTIKRPQAWKPNHPVNCQARDLSLDYPCTLNLLEHALPEIVKANKLLGLLHRSLKLKESNPQLFRTRVRPNFKYHSLFCSHLSEYDEIVIENVHRALTKQLIGYCAGLS